MFITYFFDSSSKQICWYAWLISSFVNFWQSDSWENKSSILGFGEALFTVCLKSPQIHTDWQSAFITERLVLPTRHVELVSGCFPELTCQAEFQLVVLWYMALQNFGGTVGSMKM